MTEKWRTKAAPIWRGIHTKVRRVVFLDKTHHSGSLSPTGRAPQRLSKKTLERRGGTLTTRESRGGVESDFPLVIIRRL